MQVLALFLVVVEIILCFLIYFGCVYIHRRGQHCQQQASTDDSKNAVSSAGPTRATKNVLVLVPYSVAKAFLGKTDMTSLACASCVKVFNKDDETLRLMPMCGHVFHPTCVVDPCSPSCSYCQARPALDGPTTKADCMDEEVVEIKIAEENMVRLSEEVTKKMISHAKLVLPTGKLCSPNELLS